MNTPASQQLLSQVGQVSQHVFLGFRQFNLQHFTGKCVFAMDDQKTNIFSAGNLHRRTNALGASLLYLHIPLLQAVGLGYTQVVLFMRALIMLV